MYIIIHKAEYIISVCMENRQFRTNNGKGAFCEIADVELKETAPGNILDTIFSP